MQMEFNLFLKTVEMLYYIYTYTVNMKNCNITKKMYYEGRYQAGRIHTQCFLNIKNVVKSLTNFICLFSKKINTNM